MVEFEKAIKGLKNGPNVLILLGTSWYAIKVWWLEPTPGNWETQLLPALSLE